MIAVSGATALDAWRDASRRLLAEPGCEATNLIVEIADPRYFDAAWPKRFGPRRVVKAGTKVDSLGDVANWIFPLRTQQRSTSASDFYERYLKVYERGRRRKPSAWGTYFHRLIAFEDGNGGVTNQLQRGIDVLKTWGKAHKKAVVFHVSAAHLDKPRPQGGPCLQYLQVVNNPNALDLVAVYRSHDYFQKAFGNFVGLGRLLGFICDQTGRTAGRLVCHSVCAFSSEPGSKLRSLIEEK